MIIGNVKHLDSVDNKKHLSSVKSNFIDTEIFNDALTDTLAMTSVIEERNQETPFFKKLSEDLFNSLYKPRPEVYNKSNVVESLEMENDLVQTLVNNEKFNKLRRNTAGDIFNSTFSLNTFQEEAYNTIQEWTKQSKENQDMMDKINNSISNQDELLKALENLKYDPENEQLKDRADKLKDMINKSNQEIGEQNAQNKANGNSPDISSLKQGLGQALGQAQQQTQEAQDAMDNFFGGTLGGDSDGTLSRVPYEERKRLSDALLKSSKLKEIARKLGRMKKLLGNLNKKPSKYGNSIADVGTGNNISRSLSSEKMLLTSDDLEMQFYKKFMNKELLQYETKGLEEMKGPIIICLDDSGSMSGNRDYWAKAIALVMLQLALKDKRAYRCIIFSNRVDIVFDFDKDNFSTDKMIQMAEFFKSGGTNFEEALCVALDSIEESKFKKADILFITDGEPNRSLSEKFEARFKLAKEEKEFRTQGILIDANSTRYLDEFCDSVTTFRDLNEDGELENIFSNIKHNDVVND